VSAAHLPVRDASRGPLWRRAAIGVGIAAAIVALHRSPLHDWLAPAAWSSASERLDALGPLAPVAFVAACALGIGLGLPRLGFAAAAGLAFGWLEGAALAQLGTVAGCFINFSWARYLAREAALRRGGKHWGALRARIERRPIATNVFLRLLPVGNSLALNSFLGVCPISSRDFLVGTALGTFPETLAFALFGAGAATGSTAAPLAGAAVVLLLLAGSAVAILRERRRAIAREAA